MPSANVNLVRSIYSDWERGDYGGIEWADPEMQFVIADGPDPGSWKGLAAVAKGWGTVLRSWEGYRVQAEEYRELDAERVLVLVRYFGRGKVSGLDLERMKSQGAHTFQIRGGKVAKLIVYSVRERALADLGLVPTDRPD